MTNEHSNNESKGAESMPKGSDSLVSNIFALFLIFVFAYIFIFYLSPTLLYPYNYLFDLLLIVVFGVLAFRIFRG